VTRERAAALFLLVLGCLGMLGNIVGSRALAGLAAATHASPAPKVFSAVQGLETYSTKFRLEWIDRAGAARSLALTPELYARLRGPYNRRNVYGAVLAFGPVLASDPRTRPMWESVMRHAGCGERPLLSELGIDPGSVGGGLRVVLEPLPGTDLGDLPRVLEAPCR
jgi:hypothetical protein